MPLSNDEFDSISTFKSAGWDIEMVDTERHRPFLSWEKGGGDSTWQIRESFITHTLTISIEGNGTTDPPPGMHTYYEHGKIRIEAIPDSGHNFTGWTGDITTEDDIIFITMDGDKDIRAHI